MRLFSYRNRPVHLGPFPTEKLGRTQVMPDVSRLPSMQPFQMVPTDDPYSIARAMDNYMSLLDSLRGGPTMEKLAEIPADPTERANHLKAAGYFLDGSSVGVCRLTPDMLLPQGFQHPNIDQWLNSRVAKAHLRLDLEGVYQRMEASTKICQQPLEHHTHALIYLVEFPRDPEADEPGTQWIQGMQAQRAHLRAAEMATVMALYLRNLGIEARAHTATSSNVEFNRVAVAAGVVQPDGEKGISNPYFGSRFGWSVVTTNLELQPDLPLAEQTIKAKLSSKGPAWWLGAASPRSAWNHQSYGKRLFKDSLYPMEKVKRVEQPTSLIDAERIPRVPKRAEFFIRMAFGDLGEEPQAASIGGFSITKNPLGKTLAGTLNGYAILQRGGGKRRTCSRL